MHNGEPGRHTFPLRGSWGLREIPRDSLRQKFLPQIKKGALFGFAAFLPDVRRFFLNCGRTCFQFCFPPDLRRKSAGMLRKSPGMRRKFPESKRCCGVFVLVAAFFLFAADFLECGGNFLHNALRQKFPPKEVLGMLAVLACVSFLMTLATSYQCSP